MTMSHDTPPAAMLAASGAVASAGTARAKGPRVWLDLDQQELDDAYDQAVYAPNRDQIAKRRVVNSDTVRAIIGAPERFAYGPTAIEQLDVFRARKGGAQGKAPVNIFVHGGAWRANRAADYAFLAEPFVHAGAHFVVLDFINVDEAGGNLFPMAEQVRRAIAWVHRNAARFGGDPARVMIHGESGGGREREETR